MSNKVLCFKVTCKTIEILMPPGQKAKCQSSSKTTTERNLRDDIMLAVRYLNDLEITFPLPERSVNFLKT